jgi:hypothetical protein
LVNIEKELAVDGLRETNTVPIFSSHAPSSRLDEYFVSTKLYDNQTGLVKQLAKSLNLSNAVEFILYLAI